MPASCRVLLYFIAVESGSGTLIKYEERCSTGLSIDVRAESAGLDLGGSVEIYSDVVDTGLDVCTPEVLIDVNDKFDFDRVCALTRERLASGDAETVGSKRALKTPSPSQRFRWKAEDNWISPVQYEANPEGCSLSPSSWPAFYGS